MATWEEKLKEVLPHWKKHLEEHAEDLEKWANLLEEEGKIEIATKLRKAKEHLLKSVEFLN